MLAPLDWPPRPTAPHDVLFGHDGAIWWPLRTPDGRHRVARARWEVAGQGFLAMAGPLLLLFALGVLMLTGVLSMGAAPDTPPDPAATPPEVWRAHFLTTAGLLAVVGVVAVVGAFVWHRALLRVRLASGGLQWVWSPAPGWPAPPAGFTPSPGWRPAPWWPAPPDDWRGWSVAPAPPRGR